MIHLGAVVLIVINLSTGDVHMQEFDDMDSCVAAAQFIKSEVNVVTYCLPKGRREDD